MHNYDSSADTLKRIREIARSQTFTDVEILMLLQHPNVVAAYGTEVVDGLGRCIVMEYVNGVTLKEWLEEKPSRRMRLRVMQ